jgi:hypothetical protein
MYLVRRNEQYESSHRGSGLRIAAKNRSSLKGEREKLFYRKNHEGSSSMKKRIITVVALISLAGCAIQERRVEQSLTQPINCATSEGDIRVLESEKAHVGRQIVAGVTSIAPAGIVLGLVTGTTGTKLRVATGEYNQKIDERIADIKRTCGV